MSYRTIITRQKIVGLLRQAPDKTMTYEQLDQATDGIPTALFDESLAELVANDDVQEKEGSYKLVKLTPEVTAPSVAAVRGLAARAAPSPDRPEGAGSFQLPGSQVRASADRGRIESIKTRSQSPVGTDFYTELLKAINQVLRDAGRPLTKYVIHSTLGPQAHSLKDVQRALVRWVDLGRVTRRGKGRSATYELTPIGAQTPESETSQENPMAKTKLDLRSFILKAFNGNPGEWPAADIAENLQKSGIKTAKINAVKRELKAMVKDGLLITSGTGRGTKYAVKGSGSAPASAVEAHLARAAQAAKDAVQTYIDERCASEELDHLRKIAHRAERDLADYRARAAG